MGTKTDKKSKQDKKMGKKPPPPPKPVESSEESDSDDSSEEEVMATKPKAPPAKPGLKRKAEASDNDSDDSDESDGEPPKKSKNRNAVQKPAKPVAKKLPAKPVKQQDSDEDSSSEDNSSSEDEEPPKAKKAAQPTAKKTKPAPAEDSDDDDDSSEDDSEEEPAQKAKPTKKAAPAKQADSSEEEDDEDEDEDEEEDDEEEEEASVGQKRKKAMKESTPAKKAKTEETISLFVGNLDPTLPPQKVEKFFKKNGIDVAEVRKPDNKRFCYVDLANADDLEDALALSGKMLGTEAIKVDKARQRNDAPQGRGQDARQDSRKSFGNDDEGKVLFVKNLAESVTEEQLQELFPKAHTVRMPTNRDTGTHKGYAFIEFEKEADVDAALEEKQGEELEGSSLYLDKASNKPKQNQNRSFDRGQRGGKSPGASRGETNVLIAKNLNYQTDNDSLREAFEGATTARVVTDWDSGRSKGFGFVEFSSPEAAAEAFDSMSGQSIDGRQVTLDFASPGGRGGGGRGGGGRGGRGRGGFGDRGRGGFGDRGRGGRGGGRGRGGFGDRGRGGRGGGPPPAKKGTIQDFQGKKKTFDDSD